MSDSPQTTEARVLEAAATVLERDGSAHFTLQAVAAEAGASRMTLHRRGLSREELLRRLREQMETSFRDALWTALTAPGTARERLELALRGLCRAAERHHPLLDALLPSTHDELFHDEDVGGLTRATFTAPLARLLTDGAIDGTLARQDDVEETATVIFNLIGLTYRHLRAGHGWSQERAASALVRVTMHGLT